MNETVIVPDYLQQSYPAASTDLHSYYTADCSITQTQVSLQLPHCRDRIGIVCSDAAGMIWSGDLLQPISIWYSDARIRGNIDK